MRLVQASTTTVCPVAQLMLNPNPVVFIPKLESFGIVATHNEIGMPALAANLVHPVVSGR